MPRLGHILFCLGRSLAMVISVAGAILAGYLLYPGDSVSGAIVLGVVVAAKVLRLILAVNE